LSSIVVYISLLFNLLPPSRINWAIGSFHTY